MKDSKETNAEQRALFERLISDSKFDDAVDTRHQNKLRESVLRAFDDSRNASNSSAIVEHETAFWSKRFATWIGVVAAMAACLIAMGTLWFSEYGNSVGSLSTELPAEVVGIVERSFEPMFHPAITEVAALQDKFPVEVTYDALAMCEHEHEAKRIEFLDNQMHWLDASSFESPSIELPKG